MGVREISRTLSVTAKDPIPSCAGKHGDGLQHELGEVWEAILYSLALNNDLKPDCSLLSGEQP